MLCLFAYMPIALGAFEAGMAQKFLCNGNVRRGVHNRIAKGVARPFVVGHTAFAIRVPDSCYVIDRIVCVDLANGIFEQPIIRKFPGSMLFCNLIGAGRKRNGRNLCFLIIALS